MKKIHSEEDMGRGFAEPPNLQRGPSNYYRDSKAEVRYREASKSFSNAIAFAIGNFVFFGLTLPIGLFLSWKAYKHGHEKAWIPFAANLVYLPFAVMWIVTLVQNRRGS